MKKIIFFNIALLLVASSAFAQVPDDLRNIFKIQHPGAAAVTWSTVEDGLYKVSFMEDGERNVAVYDRDMKPVWQRGEVAASNIPAPVREYVTVHMPQEPNYKVLVLDEGGQSIYYVGDEKQKKTYYLDKQGRLVKTVVESTKYPENITTYFTKKYPQAKFTTFSEDANGNITYYTIYKGKRQYFDKEGNFIREDYYYDYDYEE